jgi:3',5'-cyclic AMP phosphodiesterase CpdA
MVSFPDPSRSRRLGVPVRPAGVQVSRRHGFRSNQTFEPLPPPTGSYPYHFDLADVLSAEAMASVEAGGLSFHCAGDTGGVKAPQPQQIVADWMANDLSAQGAPSFFYHLGDVVYYNGQRSEYYPQFYEPYAGYGAPILAIPGNHDGDPLDAGVEASLAAFVDNFCSPEPRLLPEAEEVQRDAMTQPNPYWTLTSSLLTIVGLYTNVPEGGRLDQDQADWLQAELASAPSDRALLVAMHHPIYSADAHHGGSAYMGGVLDAAIAGSGRIPDVVLTAHVHNYQRFTRSLEGHELPYLVAGAGGYWHLHYMAKDDNGQPLPTPWQTPDATVTLRSYCEDRHGYLRLTVTKTELSGEYVTVPRPQESWRHGPVTVADHFTVDLQGHTVQEPPAAG